MANGKELLDKVSAIKHSTGDIGYERNRATWDGALIGMTAGFGWGFIKKQNMLMWGMLGAVGGAIITRVLIPK